MRNTWKTLLLLIGLVICQSNYANSAALQNPQVQQFMQQMVQQHHFKKSQLRHWFSEAHFNQRAIDLMNKPYEAKPWYKYRKLFISQRRIDNGVQFWRTHKKVLNTVAQRTGVPVEILVAIMGIETHYGKIKGDFSAFDVLYTFAFHYPRRATFFRKELKEFLLLCRGQNLNPLKVEGSYAGALGQPQFMPSSYRAYAHAYDGGKHINLFDNENDVISSIANYFKVHGWQAGQPIATKAKINGTAFNKLQIQDRNSKIAKPKLSLQKLQAYGVHSMKKYPRHTKATFMRFDLEQGKAYWLGFTNFYVITRYNTSKLYAMAVYQLATAIKQQYQQH